MDHLKKIGLTKLFALNSNAKNMPLPSPLYVMRGAVPQDANAVLDIDIKCFEDAWSPEEWSSIGHSTEHAMSVVTFYGKVVAVGVFEQAEGGIKVRKIAVLKPHRRKGVSLLLLGAGVNYAVANKCKSLFIIVPESKVYPGPDSAGEWLKTTGFIAQKKILPRHFKDGYGLIEDGIKLVRSAE